VDGHGEPRGHVAPPLIGAGDAVRVSGCEAARQVDAEQVPAVLPLVPETLEPAVVQGHGLQLSEELASEPISFQVEEDMRPLDARLWFRRPHQLRPAPYRRHGRGSQPAADAGDRRQALMRFANGAVQRAAQAY
jgi:hypothetical protein